VVVDKAEVVGREEDVLVDKGDERRIDDGGRGVDTGEDGGDCEERGKESVGMRVDEQKARKAEVGAKGKKEKERNAPGTAACPLQMPVVLSEVMLVIGT
jgi:hypothetical protein